MRHYSCLNVYITIKMSKHRYVSSDGIIAVVMSKIRILNLLLIRVTSSLDLFSCLRWIGFIASIHFNVSPKIETLTVYCNDFNSNLYSRRFHFLAFKITIPNKISMSFYLLLHLIFINNFLIYLYSNKKDICQHVWGVTQFFLNFFLQNPKTDRHFRC